MNKTNSTSSSDWVRLNVGGTVFQTTKDTLSRYPDSFLARLVNSGIPSEKDESGAYLIDADPEHFRTVLNYLRRGSAKLDPSKMNLEDLLREADFYNIQPLVNEVRRALSYKAVDPTKEILNKMSQQMATISNDINKALSTNEPTMEAIKKMSHEMTSISKSLGDIRYAMLDDMEGVMHRVGRILSKMYYG